jgi:glycerol-3-phosphate O-acyltransferase
MPLPSWLLALLIGIPAWELLRWQVVGRLRKGLEQRALAYVKAHQVQLEAGRFLDRIWIQQRLLSDVELDQEVASAARERGVPVRSLQLRVEDWIREMTPAFSLAAYYRFGAMVSKLVVGFAYELVFDRNSYVRATRGLPEGAIQVFVINHRSNADYIVLSYGLLRHMALSYAVGEWARVWPLDALFRSFGSFFIRRGEKDRLYHKVLERFVQVLIARGGTMGFFIEGGLSRDGLLRPPKAGLLDYIVGIRRQYPEREIVFIPVGLAYDRVLEDRMLLSEGERAPGLTEKLTSLAGILVSFPRILLANLWGVAIRSHQKLGYAAVAVGQPVLLSTWEQGQPLATMPEELRRPRVKKLAADLLGHIAKVIPVTPVSLVAEVLVEGPVATATLRARVRDRLTELRAAGRPIARGRAFPEGEGEDSGIEGLDAEISSAADAERTVDLALRLLRRRKLVRPVDGRWAAEPGAEGVLRYYARALVVVP